MVARAILSEGAGPLTDSTAQANERSYDSN
jgi:hypothetical protein